MAKQDPSDSNLFAFLGVLLTVIGFIVVYATKKDDKYAMFYAKQGLVLFFAWIIVWIVGLVLVWIPVIGWIIHWALIILLLIAWILGMINAFSGQMKEIPFIGGFAKKINV